MPSSPEPSAVPWQPAELRPVLPTDAPPVAESAALALFEVGGDTGVPERLLGPARAAAEAAGYAAGWAAGIRAAEERSAAEAVRVRAENDRMLAEQRAAAQRGFAALDGAAAALEARALPSAQELETLIVSAALDIAEALVGHALRDDAVRAPAALARVLALAPVGEPVTVRLSPADHAVLLAGPRPTDRDLTLVADPALAPGDAVATTGATEVDARIRAGVLRVRQVLGR